MSNTNNVTLTVDAKSSDWTSSGISLKQGDSFSIEVQGSIIISGRTHDQTGRNYDGSSVNGSFNKKVADNSFKYPGLLAYGLIAKIGDNQPFDVQIGSEQLADQAGILGFLINESKGGGGYADNSGKFTVSVSVAFPVPVVYDGQNYTGNRQSLAVGTYNDRQHQLSIGNDKIRSIKVPQGWKVTLYEHWDFKGNTNEFTADAATLPEIIDQKTSGIKVERVG